MFAPPPPLPCQERGEGPSRAAPFKFIGKDSLSILPFSTGLTIKIKPPSRSMFHVSTAVAESFPTTTRITKTSFLLNVQRYYSKSPGTKHILSDPIYYINFLHTLGKARPIDVAAEIESNGIPTPTGRMLVAEMGERLKKNPYGMMSLALSLRSEVPRNRALSACISSNEVRRRCLQEMYQQARVAVGLPRDASNAKESAKNLWRRFVQSSAEQRRRTWQEIDEGLLGRFTCNLKRKSIRQMRRRPERSRRSRPRTRIPSTGTFSERRTEKKIKYFVRRQCRRIDETRLRLTIAEVAEHVRQEEKAMVATDASVWAVSTWNVDKNANTIPNFARNDEVNVVPSVTDVLCVTEAQKYVPGTTRRPPTMFRQSTWTSSTIGATQVLVRYPHTLVEEMDVGVFPHTLIDSPDDGVDIDDEESPDSAEITVCRVRDGRALRQLATPEALGSNDIANEFFVCSIYLPPCQSIGRFKELVTHVTKVCGDLQATRPIPIILAGDFNTDLLEGRSPSRSREVASRKRAVWSETWNQFLAQNRCNMEILHKTNAASFTPTCASMNESLLDAVYLVFKDEATATPLPSLGFFSEAGTQHSIVTGHFTLNDGFSIEATGNRGSERIKWEKVRYDVQVQDELRMEIQAELVATENLSVESLTQLFKKTAAHKLGTTPGTPAGPLSSSARSSRAGTERRRAQAWNTRSLDSKAKAITALKRRIEAINKKLSKARVNVRFSNWRLYQLHVELQRTRSDLRSEVDSFVKESKATRQRYYDEANRHLRTDSAMLISQSHKTRRRVFRMRQPRNQIAHDAQTLNREWQKILSGDGEAPRPNRTWLESKVQSILERARTDQPRIEIGVDRVKEAVSRIKNGKSPGIDGIANEGLKLLAGMEDAAIEKIAALFEEIVNDPNAVELRKWKAGLLVLIPKETEKDAVPKATDYRPISLLSHIAKLLEVVTLLTIEEEYDLDGRLSSQQFGFRRKSGTADAQFNLRAIHELCAKKGHPLLVVLLDIKKAFDSVPFDVIASSLDRLKIPPKMIRFLRSWVEGQTRKIIAEGNDSEDAWLKVLRGVPQGSALSPLLFAAVMDTLDGYLKGESVLGCSRLVNEDLPQRLEIGKWLTQMYADDTVLFGHSIGSINRSLDHIKTWASYAGLTCHPAKFKLLRLGALTLRYSNGAMASRDASAAPREYIAEDAGNRGKVYRCVDIKKIEGNIVFDGSVILLSESARYLGIDILGGKSSRLGTSRPAEFVSRVEQRIAPTRANIEATKFAFRVGDMACNVKFAAALNRPLAEGIYFGVEMATTSPKQSKAIRTVVGLAAKASLGMHKSASTSGALTFLGWQEPGAVIALRTLGLLRKKATARDTAEGWEFDPPAMLIADGENRATFSPFLWDLRHRLAAIIGPEAVERHFPDSGAVWKRNMLADRSLRQGSTPTPETSWSARSDINALIEAIKKCDAYNHQHPIVRVAQEHAFAAFKFTCYSLTPFRRPDQQLPLEKCELCGREGLMSGFHLLTSCSHRQCQAIMAGILTAEDIDAWRAGRESDGDDYSRVNVIIERDNSSLSVADDKARAMLLVNSPNNDLDVLARLLIRELRESSTRSGIRKWRRDEVVRRGGDVELYQINGLRGRWSSLNAEKELLYTAYRWVAKLCYQLWKVRRDAYRSSRTADRRQGRTRAVNEAEEINNVTDG